MGKDKLTIKEKLTPKEKIFCTILSDTNNRITALRKAGYCKHVFKDDKKDEDLTANEKHLLSQHSYLILQKPRIQKEIDRLVEEKMEYLREHGVMDELDVLIWLSDTVKGKLDNCNPFTLQSRITGAKELLSYYKDRNKYNYKKKSEEPKKITEAKRFIIEYMQEREED